MQWLSSTEKYLIFSDGICNSPKLFWIFNCNSTYWTFFPSHLHLHIQYKSFPSYIIISRNFRSQNQTYVIIDKGRQPLTWILSISQFLWNHSKDRPRGTSAGANISKPGLRFQGKKLQVHEDGGWKAGRKETQRRKGDTQYKKGRSCFEWQNSLGMLLGVSAVTGKEDGLSKKYTDSDTGEFSNSHHCIAVNPPNKPISYTSDKVVCYSASPWFNMLWRMTHYFFRLTKCCLGYLWVHPHQITRRQPLL